MISTRAVFLDKDGTLVRDIPYNADPSLMQLVPGVGEGLKELQEAGYRLIVVTNQSGIARGYFIEQQLVFVEWRLREMLGEFGILLSGFYYCPHHPDGTVQEYAVSCSCRKPQPGLLERAADEQRVDLAHSWMVGDILDDIEAGHRAGCRSILIDNGSETEWLNGPHRQPDYMVAGLDEAARIITACDRIAHQV